MSNSTTTPFDLSALDATRPIVFVVGPTAMGKSDFALSAAAKKSGAIINADSLQVFRGLNIGTAKPTAEERAQLPHFLFDIRNPDEEFTAGDYRQLALQAVVEQQQKHLLFVVGGSGFYLRAFEKGMYEVRDVPKSLKEELLLRLENEGVSALYQQIADKDPAYATQLSENDSYRVVRALGLMLSQGKTMTEIQAEFKVEQQSQALPMPIIKIGFLMDREKLRSRVEQRVRGMVEQGLQQEVEGLCQTYSESARPLQSVGYKETLAYLHGQLNAEAWVQEIVTNTMRLAKRQSTWFRRDPQIKWFDPLEGWEQPLAYLDSKIESLT